MRVLVNWPTVEFGLIVLCLVIVVGAVYAFLEARRIKAEERYQNQAFTQDMAAVELPEWNGATYDYPAQDAVPPWEAENYGGGWTPQGLAYLADDYVPAEYTPRHATAPQPAVRALAKTGPLPVIAGTPERDEFMDKLRADNQAFLATLDTV